MRDRLTATLIKRHTGHSPSGLFTPLTDGDGSGPGTQPGSRDDKDVDAKVIGSSELAHRETREEAATPSLDEPLSETQKADGLSLHIDTNITPDNPSHMHHEDEDADGDDDPDYISEILHATSSPVSRDSPDQSQLNAEAEADDHASTTSALTPLDTTFDRSL